MIECFVLSQSWFWIITLLLVISEALGNTKLVKANGVLSLILDLLMKVLRFVRRFIVKR